VLCGLDGNEQRRGQDVAGRDEVPVCLDHPAPVTASQLDRPQQARALDIHHARMLALQIPHQFADDPALFGGSGRSVHGGLVEVVQASLEP